MHESLDRHHEGWIKKRSSGNTLQIWQRRYFIISIQQRTFAYYQTTNNVFPHYFISLYDIINVKRISNSTRFDVYTNHRTLHLDAYSTEAAQQWITAIGTACRNVREMNTIEVNRVVPDQPIKLMYPRRVQQSSITSLKIAFFQLNYSLSAINQLDFFQHIVHDFETDHDVLAFILDVTLCPDSNIHSAQAIRLARQIEADQMDTYERRSRTPLSSALHIHDIVAQSNSTPRRQRGKQRSNSDCSFEVLTCLSKSRQLMQNHRDDLYHVVQQSSSSRIEHYALLHASASRINIRSVLDARARVVAWLHGDESVHLLVDVAADQPRLALTSIFALLLARHHEDNTSPPNAGNQLVPVTVQLRCDSRTSDTEPMSNDQSNNFVFHSKLVGSDQPLDVTGQSLDVTDQFLSPTSKGTRRQDRARTSPVSKHHSHSMRYSDNASPRKRSARDSSADISDTRHWRNQTVHSCRGCRAASDEFVQIIQSSFCKASISHSHIKVLLSMLCIPASEFGTITNIYNEKHNVFNKPVVNPYVWPALFAIIQLADESVKQEALKHCSGFFIGSNGSEQNYESLIELKGWQTWLMSFFHSQSGARNGCINSQSTNDDQVHVSYQKYAHNLLSLLHFHILMHHSTSKFAHVFENALILAQQVRTKHTILSVMIQRLISKIRNKTIDLTDRWSSVLTIISLTLNHVLMCTEPQSVSRVQQWKLSIHDNRELISRCITLLLALRVIPQSYDGSIITSAHPNSVHQIATAKVPCQMLRYDTSTSRLINAVSQIKPTFNSDIHMSSEQDRSAFLACQAYAAAITDLDVLLSVLASPTAQHLDRLSLLSEKTLNDMFSLFIAHEKREKTFSLLKLDRMTE